MTCSKAAPAAGRAGRARALRALELHRHRHVDVVEADAAARRPRRPRHGAPLPAAAEAQGLGPAVAPERPDARARLRGGTQRTSPSAKSCFRALWSLMSCGGAVRGLQGPAAGAAGARRARRVGRWRPTLRSLGGVGARVRGGAATAAPQRWRWRCAALRAGFEERK